ncbi:MAG: indole-3-glycerol-phosphate synthase [Planctomycetes bacterium]|nr:indole-3-glycerol-phosphate synthase [Planctomycetota bacterium]
MPDFLQEMADLSRKRAALLAPHAELVRRASDRPAPQSLSLRPGRLEVIAEIKRRAPSAGALNENVDVAKQASAYTQAGACAISVLTEPSEFLGRNEDIALASRAGAPIMRKDFLVSPEQILEARALGADGVLLIAAILPGRELATMLQASNEAGLFALVEAFDKTDLERAAEVGARFIGVNCRNLRDLSIEFARFEQLRGLIPKGAQAVAESGITSARQFLQVRSLGYDAALIGSALMKGVTLEQLKEAQG